MGLVVTPGILGGEHSNEHSTRLLPHGRLRKRSRIDNLPTCEEDGIRSCESSDKQTLRSAVVVDYIRLRVPGTDVLANALRT